MSGGRRVRPGGRWPGGRARLSEGGGTVRGHDRFPSRQVLRRRRGRGGAAARTGAAGRAQGARAELPGLGDSRSGGAPRAHPSVDGVPGAPSRHRAGLVEGCAARAAGGRGGVPAVARGERRGVAADAARRRPGDGGVVARPRPSCAVLPAAAAVRGGDPPRGRGTGPGRGAVRRRGGGGRRAGRAAGAAGVLPGDRGAGRCAGPPGGHRVPGVRRGAAVARHARR